MDSDSSHDGDHQNACKRRDWENRQNSDVSDDENFSRGAKSIDSPPESPPRGGGNLDSPPASPAQGVESPHSVYSGSRHSSGSSDGTGDYGPQSPASLHPKSPESPDHDDSHSRGRGRSQTSDHEQSRDRTSSRSRSRSGSPDISMRNKRSESLSPRSKPRRERYGSPESNDSQSQLRNSRGPASPEEIRPLSRENSFSPQRRLDHSTDRSPSPEESQIKSRGRSSSPLRPIHRGIKSPDEYSRSPVRRDSPYHSQSNSPYKRHERSSERNSGIVSPDNCSTRRQSGEWEHSSNASGTPNKTNSPSRRSRGSSQSSSNSGSPSPVRVNNRNIGSPTNVASPERNSERDVRSRERSVDRSSHGEESSRKSHLQRRLSTDSQGSRRSRKCIQFRKGNGSNHERHKPSSYGPDSPDKHSDSDGRSNISSNSSLGSPSSNKSRRSEHKRGNKPSKIEIKSHGEDLSDVSDIESIGSVSEEEHKQKESKKHEKEKEEKEKKNGMNIEEAEQLDFEVEENETQAKKTKEIEGETEEGEVKELEEGELSDEGEVRPEETEPRPVCRFFSRGQCTWGSSCRFVHPGVTDKGNYTMFDMVRPLVPMNVGPPPPHMYPPMDCYRPPIERPPMMGPPPYQQPMIRREEPPGESAWERGLRQAKEMLRRSTKRKETDADFEEKKMTLSLSGQEEYDKENDYFPRPSSPIFDDYHERPAESDKRYRSVSDRFGDYPPPTGYYRDGWYEDRPPHYHRSSRHHSGGGGYGGRGGPDEYYDSRKKKYSSREVTVQRGEKGWKDTSPPSARSRGRGDEWADPWMRSKSPSRKGATRKKSYSSRSRSSSYSSSSSSRSSSYSSYSRSRSRSPYSRSGSSRSRSRSSFSRKKLSPLSRRAKSPFSRDRRVGDGDRGLHMNPPPPSPRGLSPRRNPTPPPQADRANRNISARLLAAAMRDRSVSSRSSSGSESSGSSSDSSSESGSSSSSSSPVRHKPSLQTRKKLELDEKLAQAVKAKAMDALKLSGQKQQIKLTLKGTGSSLSERVAIPLTRKRPAPDSPNSGDDSSPNVSKKKSAPSRREELLKQLKAVEDAIARKRSKV